MAIQFLAKFMVLAIQILSTEIMVLAIQVRNMLLFSHKGIPMLLLLLIFEEEAVSCVKITFSADKLGFYQKWIHPTAIGGGVNELLELDHFSLPRNIFDILTWIAKTIGKLKKLPLSLRNIFEILIWFAKTIGKTSEKSSNKLTSKYF